MALARLYLQYRLARWLKVLCFVGMWCFAATVFLASFMNYLWSFLLVYGGLFGLFVGLVYMIPFRNTYAYFPNRKGMCAGVCMMGYGIGSFIYNQIFLHLVNPDNLPSNDDHIFPQSVANNFPGALRVLALVYFSIGTLGCLLFFPIRPEDRPDQSGTHEHQQSLLTSPYHQPQPWSTPTSISPHPLPLPDPLRSPSQWSLIVSYLSLPNKKQQYVKLWLTVYSSSVYGVFIAYNYKEYGESIVNNDHLITLTGSLGCIANSLGRIFWCSMLDFMSFRNIMTLLDGCLLGLSLTCVFVQNQYVFVGVVVLTYFFSGAFYGLMPTQAVRMFGENMGIVLYPFIFSGFPLASCSQFGIHELVIRKWGYNGFRYVFIGFAVLQLMGIILIRVFKYPETDKKSAQKPQSSSVQQLV